MKIFYLLTFLISNFIYSQTLVKTYYDPLFKTKLKEVYQVKKNTPIANGYYKSYDEYGYLLVHRNYINNNQNGKSTTYYGTAEASITYGGEKCLGKVSGIFNYKNNLLDGIQLNYNYTKKGIRYLKTKENYTNGTITEYIEYFPNSKKKMHQKFNGECFEYYENGNKLVRYTLKNSVIQGVMEIWHKSGKLKEKGVMLNGDKNGEWIEYNEDGSIKSKKIFDLGKKVLTEYEKSIIEKERGELENKKIAEQTRKEQEQKEIERQRRLKIEKRKIEEDNYKKLLQQEKLEEERIRKDKEFKRKVENKLGEYNEEQEVIIFHYRVIDQFATSLVGGTIYKYKKKRLFNAYQIAITYLTLKIETNDINKKNDFLNTGLKLIENMKILRDQNTKSLEKKLKKVKSPERILEIILGK